MRSSTARIIASPVCGIAIDVVLNGFASFIQLPARQIMAILDVFWTGMAAVPIFAAITAMTRDLDYFRHLGDGLMSR